MSPPICSISFGIEPRPNSKLNVPFILLSSPPPIVLSLSRAVAVFSPVFLSLPRSFSVCLSSVGRLGFCCRRVASLWPHEILPRRAVQFWCIYNIQGVGNYREFMSGSFLYDSVFIFLSWFLLFSSLLAFVLCAFDCWISLTGSAVFAGL